MWSDVLIVAGAILLTASIGATVLVLLRREAILDERPAPRHRAPVEHQGATEGWSPAQELEQFAAAPITDAERWAADEAALRRQTREEFEALDQQWQASIDDTFERALTHAERLGHLEVDTQEVPRSVIADLLAAGRRSAR